MLILLSPTKKQKLYTHNTSTPLLFDDKKSNLVKKIQQYSLDDIQRRYKISDKLASDTHARFQNYKEEATALFTYNGDAFSSMDPSTLTNEELAYANKHLRIFSALYGLLQPLNKISLYRLDMLTKLDINLYDYWSKSITDYLNQEEKTIINLASQEFSSIINFKDLKVPIINIGFFNKDANGNLRVVSSHAKKARGAFARELIKHKPKDIKSIEVNGYKFSHINESLFIFIKE